VSAYSVALQRRSEGHLEEAVTLFREAIAQDADFAGAHEQLADLLISERHYTEGYAAWLKAISILKTRNLTTRERYRTEGNFYYDVYDWNSALAACNSWVARFPNDFSARYQLASVLSGLARYEEAIEQFRACLHLTPYYGSHHHLIRLYLLREDKGQATRELVDLKRSGPASCGVYNDGYLAFVNGRAEESADHFGKLAAMPPDEWTASAPYLQACVSAESGDLSRAAAIVETRIRDGISPAARPSAAEHCAGLSSLLVRIGDRKKSAVWSRAALARDPGPKIVCLSATCLARAGFPDDAAGALHTLDGAPPLPVFEIARARARGEIALARGEWSAALHQFETAARLTPPSRFTDFLAAAYLRAGKTEMAAGLYDQWFGSPAWLWRSPESELPGFVSDMVAGAVSISPRTPVPSLKYVLNAMPFLKHEGMAGPHSNAH
jgi:tetratricopeptide (TPR) repeat protein